MCYEGTTAVAKSFNSSEEDKLYPDWTIAVRPNPVLIYEIWIKALRKGARLELQLFGPSMVQPGAEMVGDSKSENLDKLSYPGLSDVLDLHLPSSYSRTMGAGIEEAKSEGTP